MSTKTRGALVAAGVATLALLVALPPGTAGAATSATVTIATVDGKPVKNGKVSAPLSGTVPVAGTADPAATTPAPAPAPLVADAGDSPFVTAGERAVLLGSAYGGTAPYQFSWSSPAGKLISPDASSTELDTTGLAAGSYPVTLTVRDATGKSTSDTARAVVYQAGETTLLDRTNSDLTPGTVATGEKLEFGFAVPAGTRRITVKLSFTNAVNDYDLEVYDPTGARVASSGASAGQPEEAVVASPAPGAWRAVAVKFATVPPEQVRVVVTGETGAADPRPEVTSGGPYAFATGAEQALRGTVKGGAAPVAAAWDLDSDGVFETAGASVTAHLPEGRHLVTLKATDAAGLERRETTSVLVADPAVIATKTTPLTVIGIADTGINPYHLEFSAQTYPDPDVLALTWNFTRHPGEYVPGYPKDAKALNITLGRGYFPPEDTKIWSGNTTVQAGSMYWIPGTKIIGAVDAGGSTGVTSSDDPHPILDDNGHGSGSASVSAGNRYGYCPTCLLVVVEALDETVVAKLPWVDISSNSFGYVGGAPVGPIVNGQDVTKRAAERGQTTLFAAGNGVGNAFDVPVSTWHSDQTGPDWNITVGAIRRDNQRAIVGDGIPVHLSSWGDGNLPSACRTGTVGQCAFGGTSAATPYTAGVFGTVLAQVRAALGDGAAGQRPGQAVAVGVPRAESGYLADGKLTRDELRQAVLKSALPLGRDKTGAPYAYPLTAPYTGEPNVLFEGYGAATPEAAQRAVAVLLGEAQLPERPFEDQFFAYDRAVRDTLWGGFDRDGDGKADSSALASGLGVDLADVATSAGALAVLQKVAAAKSPAAQSTLQPLGDNTLSYWLHRRVASTPGVSGCAATDNEQYMDRADSAGDLEPCFESRVTSVVAAYRPVGIFASTDTLDAPLPAESTVNVELYIAGETPAVIRPVGVLMATDREIGTGEGLAQPVLGSGPGGATCATLGETCWTRYAYSFRTNRPAFTGEQLTFQVQLLGARSWAFGFEGQHASRVQITPAPLPPSGLDFGVTIDSPADGTAVSEDETVRAGGRYTFPDLGEDPTGAGDHPSQRRVEVSVDDASFGNPVEAELDSTTGTWSVSLGKLPVGEHTVYARARQDSTTSAVTASTFTVTPNAVVQWQVVDRNGAADPAGWRAATGLTDWTFRMDTDEYGSGQKMILIRLVEREIETARDVVRVTMH
ncbi:S8 family serine peptidase [Micromonospora thermarum]|uniref:S8 family serine peptidase n=1 Tax=Micromonospora thermarum TaxID=2720024 RepID=A0ABX0Z2K0_9ACTN|nr:S8 family serine peptidase [Micromonospora thermarum]NJP32027.1 S8 family serine peptidase [Micromonospora thermarum]